jgi:hypothetical protein
VKRLAVLAAIALPFAAASAIAAERTLDPDLTGFQAAYTAGNGISYVVIPSDKGERVYRYGDASRETAKRDPRGFMLFTCASPHVFVPEKPEDKAALLKAKVVRADEAGFADLDAKYLAGCKNPLVKSALPKKNQ